MKIIGITGGVGAGKTTVVDTLLTHYDVVFLCCDTIAHDLMKKGNVAYEQIVNHYGEKILGTDGEIDRKKLSEEAFLNDMIGSFKHKFAKKPEVIEGNMKALELALNQVTKVN